ncbi:FG-GAP-like repeat-containing protein [Fodinibius sediminis]|uniref:ASPIC and UnbV n=1 Tax=Fodinibius sediminis TaxID=1214077 RepID=A0A521ECX6_9BACT|nr:FG-GAP-like repeat-containing protein [Fodinibius sediminis]SMO81774.1 ASPIC and UnbV [Fodinibius sediminis]
MKTSNSQKVHHASPVMFSRLTYFLLLAAIVGCTSSPELSWHEEKYVRWAALPEGSPADYGFERLTSSATGISFNNRMGREELADNRHYLNGSGVAAGDVDGDGLVDLYFAGLKTPNRLYKNMGGMEFRDITEKAGVAHEEYYSTGAVFADVNSDGHLDLLVTSVYKDNTLYINDGKGNFKLRKNSGLGPGRGSTTMTLADIDGDRDLDLYVAKYKEKSVKDRYSTEELDWNKILNEPYTEQQQTGPYTLVPPFDKHYQIFMTEDNRLAGLAETGAVDELYLNKGGRFEKVSDSREVFRDEQGNPLGLQPDWGLTARFQDLNGDRLPDLYVCNDFFTKDRVWINQGEGTFRRINKWAIRNLSFACMGVDFSDINRDGLLDIFTAEMLSSEHSQRLQQVGSDDPHPERYRETGTRPTYNRNSLYLGRNDHTYAEIAYLSGVEATGWSWDATFMDIDLDGYEDLIVNNGYLYHILDMDAQINMMRKGRNMDEHFTEFMQGAPSLELRNRVFMNSGDLTFKEDGTALGFTEKDISHGMAVADLNNDGSLDLATNRMNDEAGIYLNQSSAPRIAVRLNGKAPNTQAIGAKIELRGGPTRQQQEVVAGGDYLSGSDPLVTFAANPDNANHQLIVSWPGGGRTRIDSISANRIYEIDEAGNVESTVDVKETGEPENQSPLFKEVSGRIDHSHRENAFDDFQLQPLLPLGLGRLGPGISWVDLDRDGDDDLVIGTGKGGTTAIYENGGDGSFQPWDLPLLDREAPGDQTGIIGWTQNGHTNLMIGNANYEQGNLQAPSAYQYRMDGRNNTFIDSLPHNISTTGPLAASDYDGDGDLDLFVGGGFIPGHYPMDAPSRLLVNEAGSFVPDKRNSRAVRRAGLITGAVFTDYDQDGDPDLVLSRAWDSILILENNGGAFSAASEKLGLSGIKGWWNGIASGDFNNDGRPDLVATNWGQNSPYQMEGNLPLRMYHDDFNRDTWIDIIETHGTAGGDYVPRRRLFHYGAVPAVANRMHSHEQFANSTMAELFGNRLSVISYKEVNTLQHQVFVNTGDGFAPRPLPGVSQFSAAFHAGVADMDNDGNEDLFLSQNFFAVPRQVPRQDAGRGIWLKGDGKGGFTAVPGSESGIKIYGEQRGAAFSDFNGDGKIDLAVSQNNAGTRLFVNQADSRGYRITLAGPPENSSGIGSAVRLVYQDGRKGPLREVQAGSGYWSQNSATQVLGDEGTVDKISIRWPDGHHQVLKVEKGKKEYRIFHPSAEGH